MKIRLLEFKDIRAITRLYMSLNEEERLLFHPFPFNYFIAFLIFLYFALSNKIYKITGFITRYTIISFICYKKETMAGLAFISKIEITDGRKVAGNFGIVIRREFRSQGLGKKLATKIIEFCKNERIQKIHLTVMAHNKPALNFYKKLGFKIKKRHEKREKWKNKYYSDYDMTLNL